MKDPEYDRRLKEFNLHNVEEAGRDEPMSGLTYVGYLFVAVVAFVLAVMLASFVFP